MTFMRTKSGIANTKFFFKADLMLYTEGKENADETHIIADALFYSHLFSALRPDMRIKIKCVGSKSAVQDYLTQIENNSLQGSLVAIDKDTSGINFSSLRSNFQIITHGYSWENDLWSNSLAKKILQSLFGGKLSIESTSWINRSLRSGQNRLKYICALDIAFRSTGNAALLPKDKFGIQPFCKSQANIPISKNEVMRFSSRFRDSGANQCVTAMQIFRKAITLPPNKVIQGHLWEFFIFRLIRTHLNSRKLPSVPSELLRLIGLAQFEQNARDCLDSETLDHYVREFERCGI